MSFSDLPIRRKLALAILSNGIVTLLTVCTALVVYEVIAVRNSVLLNASTLGDVVATNSTAALAFDNADDATNVLSALRADPHIVAAGLYDHSGHLFARYPVNAAPDALPALPERDGGRFERGRAIDIRPVIEGGNKRLGTLYIESDLGALSDRLAVYGETAIAAIALSLLLSWLLSRFAQDQITKPVQSLAQAARSVTEAGDMSARVTRTAQDEVGALTDAFNQMLVQIEKQHRELSDSEARLRAVLNSALSAAVVIDSSGRIIDWNARAEAIFGWPIEEAVGADVAELIVPPQFREQHRAGMAHYKATGKSTLVNRLIEMSALRRDGTEFPAELSISPLKAGDSATFCGFITDISERKLAEQKVQAQLDRLNLLHRITRAIGERQDLASVFQVLIRTLEDSLRIQFGCVCLYDEESHTLTAISFGAKAASTAAAMGFDSETPIPIDNNGLSRCVKGQLVYEPDTTEVPFPFPQRMAAAGLRSLVFAPLAVESKIFGVLIAARQAPEAFSSPDCEFLRQLSEHAALATHQVQLYATLQQAYDDLKQTQHIVMQQERLRALGQMASGIAHDINNAISPVALYTETLLEKETSLSASARRYLETIQRAIEDVAQTVSRMREFYRHRDTELTLAPVQLNKLVPQVVDLTRARWLDMPQQKGVVIELKNELSPNLPTFMGVESEIREALTNLVFNAVDSMPEGGTLTIRTGALADEQHRVYVDVIDSGVGMDADTRRRCLEPFFTTKGERGTGLGLAMVYGMVQRHSADIDIESAPGMGTRMRLMFVASTAVVSGAGSPVPAPRPSRILRILVIDDDPLVLTSVRDALESDGHIVSTADGGQKGINEFTAAQTQGEPFAVVLTDLGMPYVDGRKVAASIKAVSPTTPVIMLTGWGQRLVAENNVPVHVDRVLNKPPKLQDLRAALAHATASSAAG